MCECKHEDSSTTETSGACTGGCGGAGGCACGEGGATAGSCGGSSGCGSGQKHRWKQWVAVSATCALFAVALAQLFVAIGRAKELPYVGKPAAQRIITIAGQGKVQGIPDIANISLGYTVERADVRSAQKENTDKMNAVKAALKRLEIADKDIQTSDYSIYPQYDYKDGKQTLRGYQVTQSLTVKIRDLSKISTVLDEAGTIGLNQVGGIQFTMDDPEKLRQEARVKALEQAKEKAETLAKVAGVKLGRVISFSEEAGGGPTPIYSRVMGESLGGGAPDISAGSLDIVVNAVVQYEIE